MRAHGTRVKYVIDKCRCEPCTDANRTYARERDRHARRVAYGIEQPRQAYVDTTEARKHLLWLSSVGVGSRQVHERTGVARSAIDKIRTGKITKARPRTVERILAVGRSAAADGTLVDAKPTWRHIDDLRRHGWTNAAISRAIGNNGRSLQIGRTRVTAGTARKIEQLHQHALLPELRRRELQAERRARYRHEEAA